MTSGPPLRQILKFAVPMLIGGIFQLFYNIADMLIVGRVNGSRDLAAIGATASATFLILSATLGLATACSIVMAQHFGAGGRRMVRVTLVGSIYISGLCAIAMTVFGLYGSRTLLRLLNTPPEIMDGAATYMRICVGVGGLGAVVYNSAAAVLRAVGDSRTPLYFLILSTVTNILLDLLFVMEFGLGVAGVAAATVISQAASAVICVLYIAGRHPIFRPRREDWRPDWRNLGMIGRIGVSLALQGIFISVGEMTILGVVNSFGSDVTAAYLTSLRVQQFTVILYFTFTEAFAVFAGQNLGARCIRRIRDGFWKIGGVVMILCFVSAGAIFIFGDDFVRLFIAPEDPHIGEITEIARGYLRVSSCLYPFLALIIIHNNALRGMGDAFYPLVSGLVELFAKGGLAILLGGWFGYYGVWFAAPIGWLLGLIPPAIRYHFGGWEKLADSVAAKNAISVRIQAESARFFPK
jgi:putative MATE family efflux protein